MRYTRCSPPRVVRRRSPAEASCSSARRPAAPASWSSHACLRSHVGSGSQILAHPFAGNCAVWPPPPIRSGRPRQNCGSRLSLGSRIAKRGIAEQNAQPLPEGQTEGVEVGSQTTNMNPVRHWSATGGKFCEFDATNSIGKYYGSLETLPNFELKLGS